MSRGITLGVSERLTDSLHEYELSATGFFIRHGRVLTINKQTITLLAVGENRPCTFAISPKYAAGYVHPRFGMYTLSDVQDGDRADIYLWRINGVDVCVGVTINRRPGGQVPRAPDFNPRDPYPFHERMQAYQDWEEKGTPIPEFYLPRRKVGEPVFVDGVLSRPYPILAPPPREVKARP